MNKLVFENLNEFYYDEPQEEEKVPQDVRDTMYQVGKQTFEPKVPKEELVQNFSEAVKKMINMRLADGWEFEDIADGLHDFLEEIISEKEREG